MKKFKIKYVLFIISLFSYTFCATAQIKVADKAYKEQLNNSSYISEPISLFNSFNEYDGTFMYDNDETYYYHKNIVGDTLYTNGATIKNQFVNCIIANHKEKQLITYSGKEFKIEKGYYVVKRVVFKDDYPDEIKLLNDSNYTAVPDYQGLYRCVDNGKSNAEIKQKIEEAKINSEKCDLSVAYNYMFVLEGVDVPTTLYIEVNYRDSHLKNFIPLSYYNFLLKELKDNNVYLTYKENRFFCGDIDLDTRKTKDAITGNYVYQQDTLFKCIDIVVTENNEVCCVLNGAKTGKLSLFVEGLFEYYGDFCMGDFYSSGNPPKATIWYKDSRTKPAGKLGWERYFHMSTVSMWGPDKKYLLKVTDVNKMLSDAKRLSAMNSAQRKAAQKRLKVNDDGKQRKQDLVLLYGDMYGNLIAQNKVGLGMSPEMCKLAWGNPLKITTIQDSDGIFTTWIYNLSTFIYFKNNKVVRIVN